MRKPLLAAGLLVGVGIGVPALASVPAGTPSGLILGVSAPNADLSRNLASGVSGAAIVQYAMKLLGYPYTATGNSPSTGFSCIGFVSYVYRSLGINLPGDLSDAMAFAPPVSFSSLLPGDILYFQNTVWAGLSHAAIYIGAGKFIHAEWYNRGVVISSFTNDPVDGDYWTAHYLGANRPWSGAAIAPPAPPAPASTSPAVSIRPRIPKPQLLEGPRAQVQVAGLNVRVRPSLLAPIRRLATQGTTLVVLKQYRTWDWVQLPNGSFGWVSNTAIGVGSGSRPRGGSAPRSLPLVAASVDGLRVHVRPNLAAPAVTSASHGQRLLVLSRWLGWLRVLLPNGARGWVDGGLTSTGTSAQRAAGRSAARQRAPASPRRAGPTLTATVRVHSRPGLRAPVLRLAAAGTRIHMIGSWRMWLYVRSGGGQTGWIYRAYVRSE
jgi:SH3-like domain-containing protein